MSPFAAETATEAVLAQFAASPDSRLAEVMASIVRHLHEVVRETQPTEREWMRAVRFIADLGQATNETRNEVILVSDTLGVSALVDVINHEKEAAGATESTVLGPFFLEGAQAKAHGDAVVDLSTGEATVVMGRVLDDRGSPLAGATLDVWQTDGAGEYDVQHANGHGESTRAKFTTDADGSYWFRTVKPVSYPVPTDGPGGRLMTALGRAIIRPAHIHFMIRAEGCVSLVTHLFVEGDPHLDADPVFGVKASLIASFERIEDGEEAARRRVSAPFRRVRQDFRLQRSAQASA